MLDPGEGPGRVGSVRTLRRVGFTERIVAARVPVPGSEDAVPSVSYTLEHVAVSSYLGFVCFVPTGAGQQETRVVWSVRWTPSVAERLLFFNGHLRIRMLDPAIRQGMNDLGG